MRKPLFISGIFSLFISVVIAQKKPLDHSVYDNWQSIGEKYISNNGIFAVYTITPQEGDAVLVIQKVNGEKIIEIPRGYSAKITEDNRYVVFKIKPCFLKTRTAEIQKKKPDDMPKDSLGIFNIATLQLEKIARVKSYKLAEKNSNVLLYLLDKNISQAEKPKAEPDSLTKIRDINAMIDSLKNVMTEVQTNGIGILSPSKNERKTGTKTSDDMVEEGTELVLINLSDGEKQNFKLVSDYIISKNGNVAIIKTTRRNNDNHIKAMVIKYDVVNNQTQTVLTGFNDAKGFELDNEGNQLAFVAEKDSSSKALQKFYKLYYYKPGFDSATLIADRFTKGVPAKWCISEFSSISFSKSGKRLFFGTAPVLPQKDTSLPEFERAGVDVWNYKDDNLMPVQLKYLERDIKKNYLALYDFDKKEVIQLGNEKFQKVEQTLEGDGDVFYTSSDFGKRIARQWQGFTFSDVYALNPVTGTGKLIVKNFKGNLYPSYSGKYLLMYMDKMKRYSVYNAASQKTYAVASDIKYPLYDEENDVPDDANPYGIIKWAENDKAVLLYDKYDVWKVDPAGKEKPVVLTNGRRYKIQYRYVNVDTDEKFIKPGQQMLFRIFDDKTKSSGLSIMDYLTITNPSVLFKEPVSLGPGFGAIILKSKDAGVLAYTKETFQSPPDLFCRVVPGSIETKLSSINLQQSNYLWGTSELYKWKSYSGKETEGILYKPENFDAKKKYPMIVYFYERNNQTLYNYQPPAPTPSRLNIPFFVSRGYVVFVPDIWYKTGHPGKSAYDFIVSGTRALIKEGFIDSMKIGIQGQSWGGYQTAYVITQTNLYKAAWAGAPVVNMFSAYGGIRWETGVNRQFQYEKSQSRIGATIWERTDLYIENSPLFHLPNIKTPLVIMSNDADGAVPWYQGIEFFTAMRRLNKPVWLLVYNGEAHNLVERRNRKDIQVREQQYFDWLLKGEKPAKWITDGVPAVLKGRDWGLEVE